MWMGLGWMDGMVVIGRRLSQCTFGANNVSMKFFAYPRLESEHIDNVQDRVQWARLPRHDYAFLQSFSFIRFLSFAQHLLLFAAPSFENTGPA